MFQSFLQTLLFGCDTELSKKEFTKQPEKHLVLDIDETLIRAQTTPFSTENVVLTIKDQKFFVSPRPYLNNFFEEISKYYTISIYTTATKDYAEAVIKTFGISKYIKNVLHRDHCIEFSAGVLTKDISFLEVPMDRIFLIDDNPTNSLLQPMNFLLIDRFIGAPSDDTLLKLIPFLIEMAASDDVRDVKLKYKAYQSHPKKFSYSDKASGSSNMPEKRKNLCTLIQEREACDFSFKPDRTRMLYAKHRLTRLAQMGSEKK